MLLTGTRIRCSRANAAVRKEGSRFGGGGRSFCEETVRAGCGPLTAKTLLDFVLLHFLRCVLSFEELGDVCRLLSA